MTRESAIKIVLSMEVEPNSTNFLVKTGEKYSGITRVLPNLLDMLSKYKIPVTWFITHDYWSKIDQEFPQLVDRMHDNGEIGCHVHFRKEKEIYLTDYNFQMELIGRATYFLRDKGFNVTSFRGGNFFFDENTLKVLEELNFEIDSSVVPGLYLKPYPALTIDHKERISNEPYFPSYANHCIPGKSKILEVPISICPYFKFNGKTISVLIGKSLTMSMPTQNLLKNVAKIMHLDGNDVENSIIPIVIPSHPYDFLGNIKLKIGYLEKFISKLIQLPNVEFVTLNKIRKDYIDKKNSYNVKKPALIITASDILKILKPVKGAWNKILNLVS